MRPKSKNTELMPMKPGDVVQLDPDSELGKAWGPQFVIVEEPKPWGFQGYFIHAEKRGSFGPAYVRVTSGSFRIIGEAAWASGET